MIFAKVSICLPTAKVLAAVLETLNENEVVIVVLGVKSKALCIE